MAAANPVQSLQGEATCPICLEYYKDPVITKCGHNFCRSCISGCSQGSGSGLPCPQCREVCPQGDLRPNRQLQSMVELVKQLSLQPERAPGESLCEEHEEKLKLFCEEDGKLICVTCRESSGHRSHTVCPTEEAAQKYKNKLKEWLLHLRKEKDGLLASKLKENEASKTLKDMLGTEKQKTVVEFARMVHLLKEQERTILGRLEELERRITTTEKPNIAKLSQQISSLSALKNEIEEKCEQPEEELLKDMLGTEKQKTVAEFEGMRQLLKEQERAILGRLEEMERRITIAEKVQVAKLSQQISTLSAPITEIEKRYLQPAEGLLKDIGSTLSRCENVKLMSQKHEDMIEKYKGVILFTVDQEDTCRASWPPLSSTDDFHTRAKVIGTLENVSKIAFSPDHQLYAVRGSELYRGAMPSCEGKNWFQAAMRVAKSGWDEFRFILFHPNGTLYAATHDGDFFSGPPPTNENETWMFGLGEKIGNGAWDMFQALFFDPEGVLYGATDYTFVKDLPPGHIGHNWIGHANEIGYGGRWSELSHFMGFTPDGNLWVVDKADGDVFTAPPPTYGEDRWTDRSKKLELKFNRYKLLSFAQDTTIDMILSLEFLVNLGKIHDERAEVVSERVYDNKKKSTPLNGMFVLHKAYTQESAFSQEHGYAFAAGAAASIKGGVPSIAEGERRITLSTSTFHEWNIGGSNRMEINFSRASHFVVEPGRAVQQKAMLQKVTLAVPYRADILTVFGRKASISGTWKGVCYHDLQLQQEDI
ncbi:uncharacterized protein [Ambystoma mexicanum]|uniref:uncharacterized protein n=1 Tax=Ambystoma mexicanum TaxID=8296 RepID=UPI0037E74DD2